MRTKRNSERLLSLLLIGALCTSNITTAYAAEPIDTSISSNDDSLLITAAEIQPAIFSVSVPTSFPVRVNADGSVSTANNVSITNNSSGAVKVVDMSMQQTGTYQIIGYEENFSGKFIDTNQMALNISGSKTQNDGSLLFDAAACPIITPNTTQNITYSAKATPASAAIENMYAANIYLTIDWANPVHLNYNANGGTFTSGKDVQTIKYTEQGQWISGVEEIPTRKNCFFEGWYTDAALTNKYDPAIPTTDTTVYAKWLASYTVEYAWQRLDHSYLYEVHESETFIAPLGTVVWPEVRTYDQYKTPAQQSLTVDDSGNCVLTYKYDRTTYWLDVNYIVDDVYTGGPGDGATWPSGLYYNFMAVYLNGNLAFHGRDYCVTRPFGTYYEVRLTLGEEYYYLGTYNEGADTWDNGTTLYRKPDSGTLVENVGVRLVIRSATDDLPRYYIAFDANGGEGYTEPMTMIFSNAGSEIDWLSWCNYTREGYTFGGWMTTPDGDTAEYHNEQKVSGLSNTNGETITLYALWIPNNPFALEDEEETSEGEEIDEEMPEEDEEIGEEESNDEESPGEEETPSEEETPGEEETEQPDEGVEDEPPVDTEPPLDTEPTQPDEDSPEQEEIPDDSDTTPDSPPDTPTQEPGDETTPDVDDESTTPDVDDENESDDTPQEPPTDTPKDDKDTPDIDQPENKDEVQDPENGEDATPENTPSDDTTSDDTKEDSENDIPDESEEGEGNQEENVEDEDEDEEIVEPVYYCNMEEHKHGEDCPGATCDIIEHEHDASCLIPRPPEESVDPEPEIPEEGTQDSEETQEPPKDDASQKQEIIEDPVNTPVEETTPPKEEEVTETESPPDPERKGPPVEENNDSTTPGEETTEEPVVE